MSEASDKAWTDPAKTERLHALGTQDRVVIQANIGTSTVWLTRYSFDNNWSEWTTFRNQASLYEPSEVDCERLEDIPAAFTSGNHIPGLSNVTEVKASAKES